MATAAKLAAVAGVKEGRGAIGRVGPILHTDNLKFDFLDFLVLGMDYLDLDWTDDPLFVD